MSDLPFSEEVYCFVDTDVLIHFTNFDQVDWLTFFNAQKVFLILPITVVRELNKHKDDGSKPRLQERARDLLPKIAKLLIGAVGPVRLRQDGVFLMKTPREPLIDWSLFELDEHVHDDRILARVLLFREEYPERDVRFLTNDYAAMLKADDRGIPTLMPDGKLLTLNPLKSSVEAKLEATQKELHEYKNRVPRLEIGFPVGGELAHSIICTSSAYNAHYVEVLAQALDENYVPKQVLEQQKEFEEIVQAARGNASDYQVNEYVKKYERYLETVEPALKREFMSRYGRRCEVAFLVKNLGTAPVTDLSIDLSFPRGTLVIDADSEKDEIIIPDVPQATWISTRQSFGLGGFNIASISPGALVKHDPTWDVLRAVRALQANTRGPICNKTANSHIVSYSIKKLRHGGEWYMPRVVAYLPQEKNQGFPIEYEIACDQHLKKPSGTLSVQWKQSAVSS